MSNRSMMINICTHMLFLNAFYEYDLLCPSGVVELLLFRAKYIKQKQSSFFEFINS